MSGTTDAVKRLSEEVEQQRAAGYTATTFTIECEKCDCQGAFVSKRTVPANGPVVTLAHDICKVGGGYVYHLQGDARHDE